MNPKTTWIVWHQYLSNKEGCCISSAWHDPPKQYKTEKAARMAERDLNTLYTWDFGRINHKATPVGEKP